MATVPSADISAFISDNSTETRKAAAKELAAAVRPHGCAAITGHGLSEEKLQEAFGIMQKLFDLPVSEKMKAPHPDGFYPHRGYLAKEVENSGRFGVFFSKSESEKAFLSTALDWKETYDIGDEANDKQKNLWLPDDVLPGFKPYMNDLYQRLSNISLAILEGLMLGMELSSEDCETLLRIHSPAENHLRLAHYLPLSLENLEDPKRIRLAPHRDLSSYTLLFQGPQSGLEFQNRETGEYMPATPKEGVLYLNVGEVLERFSNGFYPSAMHRVTIPKAKAADGTIPGRYSIPFFVLNNVEGSIYPMPSRVESDGKPNYEPATYHEVTTKILSLMS